MYKFMNYQEAINYIHQTPKFARELGNRMLEKLLLHLNNPQNNLRIVHIAGTNGKGSTASMLAEILKEAGYCCGLYTSPYIQRFNERIRVNGVEIPDAELAEIITNLKNTIERYDAPVSEFALDTAAAFCWFQKQRCDIVVLETGLGGRLDATNVITNPLVTVLTAIGMDHMQYLGNSIKKITAEKCGIIKENSPVVSYPLQEREALAVIQSHVKEKNCPLFMADIPERTEDGIISQGNRYTLGLQGEFQAYNASTVLKTVEVLQELGFQIPDNAIYNGLKKAKNMARFERFGDRIILDGGHNVPAAKALVSSLKELHKPIYFCLAMMEDKDCQGYINEIAQIAKGVVVTQIPMPRCMSAQKLEMNLKPYQLPVETEEDPHIALEKTIEMAGNDGYVCVCGSLYLAGELRPFLTKLKKDGQI